ncbi:MAG: hypothetical protein FJ148_05170 [Deltaproteobacteria bacterium]|nr:hypothetical protein [Deltaproteobacteria bacterium]
MRSRAGICGIALAVLASACGGGSGGSTSGGVPTTEPTPGPACEEFDSTFAAIQQVVFENRGCTQDVCHGSARSGALDLRPGAAYANLLEVASLGSPHPRIQPGEPSESFLFQKLSAATRPGSFAVVGSPMPSGLEPLSENELEALRMWIEAGAPESGSVGDADTGSSDVIGELLDACLPPAGPITIEPLDPPAADEGVQFVMPTYVLPASTELETCFASYYDMSDVVPPEMQDPERGVFFMNGSRVRQDPQSHHFIFKHSGLDESFVHHPAFGTWTCHGGARAGEVCEPTDLAFCGDGICTSEIRNTVACIGYGPPEGALDLASGGLAGAQTAQQYVPPRDGVYREVPLRGILYWNSHAFNLTSRAHDMNGRINVFYAQDRRFQWIDGTDPSHVFIASGQPPYTIRSYCADHVVPRDVEVISISSHTHKRGKHFWVEAPDGSQIYESFVYSDPIEQQYDPPLQFDSADAKDRTLRFCATYNNGVEDDGSPDPSTVTRLSRMPDRSSCTPVACTAGNVGATCNGAADDAACDSSPGAGDGECDACPITAGVTTENEMFVIVPTYIRKAE